MANKEHLDIIKKGKDAWNNWRTNNQNILPDLSGADLRGDNLRSMNLKDTLLQNAQLVSASLNNANLSKSDLTNANLRWAHINEASLIETKLIGAELVEASLNDTKLDKSDLSRANLSNANLQGASLNEANLIGANLSNTNLQNSNLENANLTNVNFINANLSNCRLLNTKLDGANLTRANLSAAKFHGASLQKANLSKAKLSEAKAQGVDFSSANIEGADFTRVIADKDKFAYGQLSNQQREQLGFSVEITAKDPISKPLEKINITITDSKLNKEEQLRQRFIDFLKKEKGYPADSLRIEHTVSDIAVDLSIIKPGTEQVIAIIQFKAYSANTYRKEIHIRGAIFDLNQQYLQIINQLYISAYIVCSAEVDSKDQLFTIYQVFKEGDPKLISTEEFPTFRGLISESEEPESTIPNFAEFIGFLSENGRRLCREIIKRARKNDLAFKIEAPTDSYINLKTSNPVRSAAQLHRTKSLTAVALAIAGSTKEFPEPKSQPHIKTGNIKLLSGYVFGPPAEKNWLKGSFGNDWLQYEAKVYIIEPQVLENKEAWSELEDLLKLAKENAEKEKVEIPEEEQRIQEGTFGNIPTVSGDKISQEDLLGRKNLVKALADLFVHTKAEEIEGLTVALLGDWGEGKSTIMELLKNLLKASNNDKFEFAKFNAWEYEHTDNIAAGLAQEVVNGLLQKERVGFFRRQLIRFRFAWYEYRWNFLGGLLCLLVAIFTPLLLYFLALLLKSQKGGEPFLETFFGVGAAVISAPLIICLYKGFKQAMEHPLAIQMQTYLKLPTYGKHLGLVPVLKRHIKTLCSFCLGKEKKLIVFIDDLDRCHAECISKTMDAIRLVMTIPNVIVMLGIDHRIAFKAVKNYYKKLGDSGENHTKPDLGDGSENHTTADIARDYLGKIIQLPIRLMPANSKDLEQFISEKLFPNAIEVKKPVRTISSSEPPDEEAPRVTLPVETLPKNEVTDTQKTLPAEKPKEMQETTEERNKFYELANKFKFTNPRQLLRLRNSYRLLKVLDLQQHYRRNSLMTMLFWQEFLHNFPRDIRNEFMAMLMDKNRINRIKSAKAELIANDIYNDTKELFAQNNYSEMATYARVVVLPHSEEGVLDTSEEIKKWIGNHKNN